MNNYKNIHMIGIGGISMSAIAEYFLSLNYNISGSDHQDSKIIRDLRARGAKIYLTHDKNNINKNLDCVIITNAIENNNPEIIKAQELNIKIFNRAEILGEIIKAYKFSIAISGCHGKTTTSSMLSEILITDKKDPTLFLGGILSSTQKNFRMGKSSYLLLEACEYRDSFLKFFPAYSIINNLDLDHLDYFKNLEHITRSFQEFANNTQELLVINQEIKSKFNLHNKQVISFGLTQDSDIQAVNINYNKFQCAIFSVRDNQTNKIIINNLNLKLPGEYNLLNSLAAIALSYKLKINLLNIKLALENFNGTERRFEIKGSFNNALIIDDYAHHPNEIKAILNTARKINHKTLWCVFQSHTYTRTKILLNDFAHALSLADKIIILDIYAAREKNIYNIHAQDLVDQINLFNNNAIYIDSFEKAKAYLIKHIMPHDLLITMGAGEAYKIADNLIKNN